MANFVSRVVGILVAVVAILQLLHLVLLNKLERRSLAELQAQHPQQSPLAQTSPRIYQRRIQNLEYSNGFFGDQTIVDSSGEYRILFDVAVPSRISHPPRSLDDFSLDGVEEGRGEVETGDVTLVTHGDVSTATLHLIPLIERWSGPMSVSLFAPNSTALEESFDFINQIRKCHEDTRSFVSFHLIFPLVENVDERGAGGHNNNTRRILLPKRRNSKRRNLVNCAEFLASLPHYNNKKGSNRVGNNNNRDDGVFPVNLLRNVGRRRVLSDYSFVLDMHFVPSGDLRSKFINFVREKRSEEMKKTLFVLPAFESRNGEIPRDKSELVGLIDKFDVRPYFFDICWKCQVYTDYEAWGRELGRKDGLSVLFEVLWKDPWEPFFISYNSVPLFDERFSDFGLDRLSHLCELHIGGFKFALLNEAFLVHKGFSAPTAFTSRSPKDDSFSYKGFKMDLKTKYPHSTRRCF